MQVVLSVHALVVVAHAVSKVPRANAAHLKMSARCRLWAVQTHLLVVAIHQGISRFDQNLNGLGITGQFEIPVDQRQTVFIKCAVKLTCRNKAGNGTLGRD